jgi:hypothetical protein|tara:strand:+ start:965 stop:1150 length:186 start_codon:yes stop_codon:yes gene_type:complete
MKTNKLIIIIGFVITLIVTNTLSWNFGRLAGITAVENFSIAAVEISSEKVKNTLLRVIPKK